MDYPRDLRTLGCANADGSPPCTYGTWLGPSEIVAGGEVFQLGSIPGTLDAHVRRGHMQLRCDVDWITHEPRDEPLTISLNDEDGWKMLKPLGRLIGKDLDQT